jgi:hypothetical protein
MTETSAAGSFLAALVSGFLHTACERRRGAGPLHPLMALYDQMMYSPNVH